MSSMGNQLTFSGSEIIYTNQTKQYTVSRTLFCKLVQFIFKELNIENKKISFQFVTDSKIISYNKKYFKKHTATDVIAFQNEYDTVKYPSMRDHLGDIVISLDRAKRYARKMNMRMQDEFAYYVIHGILHLLGYNDLDEKNKRAMFRLQDNILSKVKDNGLTAHTLLRAKRKQ